MCNTPDTFKGADDTLFLSAVHRSSVSSETNQFLFKRLIHDVNGLEALFDATYNARCTAMFKSANLGVCQ